MPKFVRAGLTLHPVMQKIEGQLVIDLTVHDDQPSESL
jgi:hypothetical protein